MKWEIVCNINLVNYFAPFLVKGFSLFSHHARLSCYSTIPVEFGEGNGNPLQYSYLENPMDGGAWRATVQRVAKSWTRLSNFTFTFTDFNNQVWLFFIMWGTLLVSFEPKVPNSDWFCLLLCLKTKSATTLCIFSFFFFKIVYPRATIYNLIL